jgi:1-acyl-sn-glycerol-3-phosphate acyltransferase
MRSDSTTLGTRVNRFFRDLAFYWTWRIAVLLLRLLYGFRVVGKENLPDDGPFILAINEHSLIATIVGGWISVLNVVRIWEKHPDAVISYAHELLWSLPVFRQATGQMARGKYAPLMPHSAGRLALNLMPGYQALRDGGLVVINPEGDMTWDGRTITTGPGAAWLALHTGAPIVPAICSIDSYDIWPRWRKAPRLTGKLSLGIGKPFRLTEEPRSHVTTAEVTAGTERIHEEFVRLRYGPGGENGWTGPNLRNGSRLVGPLPLPPGAPVITHSMATDPRVVPVGKRDVAQLLWCCPICQTDEALVHEHVRLQPDSVRCLACDTAWEMRRVKGHDFRLKVVAGLPELIGLDLPLYVWYSQMKKQNKPVPVAVPGFPLQPGEQAYLVADDAELAPHQPSALLNGWAEREAPRFQPPGEANMGSWTSIGKGPLVITDQRIVWRSARRELEFYWPCVKAVHLWSTNVLGINYGSAGYRLIIGNENALRWLTIAGHIAEKIAQDSGQHIGLSAH